VINVPDRPYVHVRLAAVKFFLRHVLSLCSWLLFLMLQIFRGIDPRFPRSSAAKNSLSVIRVQLLKLAANRGFHLLQLGQIMFAQLRLIGRAQRAKKLFSLRLRQKPFLQHTGEIPNAEAAFFHAAQKLADCLGSKNRVNRRLQLAKDLLVFNCNACLRVCHRSLLNF
jgi:hypothetical protein